MSHCGRAVWLYILIVFLCVGSSHKKIKGAVDLNGIILFSLP